MENISTKQSELLFQVANSLLKISDLETILNRAAKEMVRAMDAVVVSVALYDKNENKLTIKVAKHRNGQDRRPLRTEFTIGEGAAGFAAQSRKIVNIANVDKSNVFVGKCHSSAKSLICIPIIFRKKLIGVLNVSSTQERKFAKEDEDFLTILATMIGAAIENSILLENIKEENVLLSSIIENTGEGVLVTDGEGKIISFNNLYAKFLGSNKNEIFNKKSIVIAKKVNALAYINKLRRLISAKTINKNVYDEIAFTVRGEKNWYGTTTSFIKDERGNLKNIVIVSRDITKEKNLLQAKSDLISTATHELRTPVTVIKGYLCMTKSGEVGKLNKLQKTYIERALSATDRLVNLIEDLLCAQRIDEKKVKTEKQTFDLNKIINSSLCNLKDKAAKKKIDIEYKDNVIRVVGDPVRTKHILENLIDNAIKYTKNNGRIVVSAQRQESKVLVSVKDDGVGIAEKNQKKIFDKFTRISNPLSVKAGGTGLGLYIAKKLIEKQGGKIWLESKLNRGTTFYFNIPSKNNKEKT